MEDKKTCECGGNCEGRKHLNKGETKEQLLHRQECLEKELQEIKEALNELNA